MSVTVDYETLETETLGLRTIGQVLSHVQRENRLVVNLLIDGRVPDLDRISAVRQSPLSGRVVFIETAEPARMALEVLGRVEEQLEEADRLRGEAVALLGRNAASRALEKLSGCFSTWHAVQESVLKTAQLLRVELSEVDVAGQPLSDLLAEFMGQLRDVKAALEDRDFVTLADVLAYEMNHTSTQWRLALTALRDVVAAAG